MTPNRAVPAVCLDLIHEFEGRDGRFEPRRAFDPAGNAEIGWSHALCGPEDPLWNATISEQTADELAQQDLDDAAAELEGVLGQRTVTALNEGQWAALIDFAYNEGIGRFQSSTLAQYVHQFRFAEVPAQLRLWVYGRVHGVETKLDGLVRRRNAEACIWLEQPWR